MRRISLCAVLLAGLAWPLAGCNRPPDPPVASKLLVRAESVRGETVQRRVSLVGTVLPFRESQVAAGAPGKVISCPVREGDVVGHEAVLAELRTVTLDIEIKAAEQLRDEKKERWQELNNGFRAEEKRKSAARKAAAAAAVKFAEAKETRLKDLYSQRKVTREELDEATSLAEQARQLLAEAAADVEEKSAGYVPEQIAQAKAAYEAQVQEVARLNDELTKRTVKAPFAGVVVKLLTEEGEWLPEGGPVATLIDLAQVEVVVNVEGRDVDLVRTGDTVQVVFAELEGEWSGEIVHFVPRADHLTGSRSFPVRVRVKNTFDGDVPRLKEGMLAQVTFEAAAKDALLVHKDAIVRTSGRPLVYKLDADDIARPVTVKEGETRGDYVEVAATELADDDRVVTEGAERLRPLQQVDVMQEAETNGANEQPVAAGG